MGGFQTAERRIKNCSPPPSSQPSASPPPSRMGQHPRLRVADVFAFRNQSCSCDRNLFHGYRRGIRRQVLSCHCHSRSNYADVLGIHGGRKHLHAACPACDVHSLCYCDIQLSQKQKPTDFNRGHVDCRNRWIAKFHAQPSLGGTVGKRLQRPAPAASRPSGILQDWECQIPNLPRIMNGS